jgi:hypothetical protein
MCVCVCTLECWSNRLRERASGSNPSDLIYLFRWFPFMISFVHLVVFFVRFFFGLDSSRHNLHKKKKKEVVDSNRHHFDPAPPSKIIGRPLPFIYLNFYQKLFPPNHTLPPFSRSEGKIWRIGCLWLLLWVLNFLYFSFSFLRSISKFRISLNIIIRIIFE